MHRPAPLSRRAFIAGAAALPLAGLGAARALGQTSGTVDVVIVGAGAAGIAAARRVAAAGLSYALLEATSRPGGRAVTDTALFGRPVDLGALRLYDAAANPLVALGTQAGAPLYAAPDAARLFVNGREAREGEYEDFVAALRQGERAIGAAGDAARDLPASRVLPDLGPWAQNVGIVLGPATCAKDLDQVSTVDFSRAEPRDAGVFVRSGLGDFLASLATPLAVRFDTPATSVDLGPRLVQVATRRGTVGGRFCILAAPPSLIAAGKLRVSPLPTRYRGAVERITLGAFDHILFEWPGNPLGVADDETLQVKAPDGRAFTLVARIGGSDLHVVEVGGKLATDLAAGPPQAGASYLKEALTGAFGATVAGKVGKVHQTRWTREPYALGAWSCALPGAGNLRRAFTEVVNGRLAFAGEHAHETLWGTVHGAWASGERAAQQAIRALGGGNAATLAQ
ncbi:MAG: amine oxidase [Rhizobiales bacterium 17-65-6]|nr:MAG: amine oxidase [Rhizobiales bacterium 17-65-6]